AVEAPRWLFGRTWGEETRSLRVEDRFGDDVREALSGRGHEVEVVEGWSDLMGHAQVIRIDHAGLTGASDPRADGAALGFSRRRPAAEAPRRRRRIDGSMIARADCCTV